MNERVRIAWLAGVNIALALLELGWMTLSNWNWWGDTSSWWNHEAPFFMGAGLMYGHVLVVGAIASMGPWRWQIRIPVLTVFWFATVAGETLVFMKTLAHPPPPQVFYCLAGSTLLILLALQLPLGPRFRWWRLRNVSASDGDENSIWPKFSVRGIVEWAAWVALLGVGRIVLALFHEYQDSDMLILSEAVAFFLLLAAPTVILLLTLELPGGFGFIRPVSIQSASNDGGSERQATFSIRDLLIWTTIVALILAGGRLLVAFAPKDPGDNELVLRLIVIFTEFVAATLLIAWPLFWAFWSPGRWWWKLLISLAMAIVGTVLEGIVLHTTLSDGPGNFWELGILILCMNLTTYLVLASHVVAMRTLNYRLA